MEDEVRRLVLEQVSGFREEYEKRFERLESMNVKRGRTIIDMRREIKKLNREIKGLRSQLGLKKTKKKKKKRRKTGGLSEKFLPNMNPLITESPYSPVNELKKSPSNVAGDPPQNRKRSISPSKRRKKEIRLGKRRFNIIQPMSQMKDSSQVDPKRNNTHRKDRKKIEKNIRQFVADEMKKAGLIETCKSPSSKRKLSPLKKRKTSSRPSSPKKKT